jgi:hypothetical protein
MAKAGPLVGPGAARELDKRQREQSGNQEEEKGSLNIKIHLDLHAKVRLDLEADLYGDIVIGLLWQGGLRLLPINVAGNERIYMDFLQYSNCRLLFFVGSLLEARKYLVFLVSQWGQEFASKSYHLAPDGHQESPA